MKRQIISISFFGLLLIAASTSLIAQPIEGYYLMPIKGGVGVQRRLHMTIVHLPRQSGEVIGKVAWKSSNTRVAVVDKEGIVTGRRKGNTTVTAKFSVENNTLVIESSITVGNPVSRITAPDQVRVDCYCTSPVVVSLRDESGKLLNDRPVQWSIE